MRRFVFSAWMVLAALGVPAAHASVLVEAKKEIQFRVVYTGPDVVGREQSVRFTYQEAPKQTRGALSDQTGSSGRMMWFDFVLPGSKLRGYDIRLFVASMLGAQGEAGEGGMLAGCDGVVFVADGRPEQLVKGQEAAQRLLAALAKAGRKPGDVPITIALNHGAPGSEAQVAGWFGAVPAKVVVVDAVEGHGVFAALKETLRALLVQLRTKMPEQG